MWFLVPFLIHIIIWFFKPAMTTGGILDPLQSDPEKLRRETVDYAFKYDTPLSGSRYEIFKMIIATLSGLSIMRLIMMSIYLFMGGLLINVGFESVGRKIVVMSLWWLGYYDIKLKGGELSEEVPILVSNHCNAFLETLVLYDAAKGPSFITRGENMSVPLMSEIVKKSKAIIVDRNIKNSRKKALHAIKKHVTCPTSKQLMIFPEGTCNNGKCLFRFNKGAFVCGLPVQPVVFNYPYKHFNSAYTGNKYGGHELPSLVFRTACQVFSNAEYKYLPVYYPSEEEKKDPILYAKNVQALMATHLHIPVTDATVEGYKKM
jgi:1-acyl-sn-glycerol-3-phosphate acyltransferase